MNPDQIIIDTGPIVSLFSNRDQWHNWTERFFDTLDIPMITCQAVLTESLFLMHRNNVQSDELFSFIKKGILIIENFNRNDWDNISKKMKKYSNIPMSFADACLVRMSENTPDARLFTLDSDFKIYRKTNNHVISLVIPG